MLRNVTNYRGNFSFGDVCQVFSLKIYLASSWFLTQYLRQCTDKSDLLWEIVNFGLHVAQDVLANRLSVILIGFCELLENFLQSFSSVSGTSLETEKSSNCFKTRKEKLEK